MLGCCMVEWQPKLPGCKANPFFGKSFQPSWVMKQCCFYSGKERVPYTPSCSSPFCKDSKVLVLCYEKGAPQSLIEIFFAYDLWVKYPPCVMAFTEFHVDVSQEGIPPACPDPSAVRPWVCQPWLSAEPWGKQEDLKNENEHLAAQAVLPPAQTISFCLSLITVQSPQTFSDGCCPADPSRSSVEESLRKAWYHSEQSQSLVD